MDIKDIITPGPRCIGPDAFLVQAAGEMKALDIGWLPVCENDILIGTLTDCDITIRAVAEGLDPNTTTVRQAMSHNIVYCFEDHDIQYAAELMEKNQIRRLPVLDQNKRLVGIISLGDLVVRTGADILAGRVLERVSEPALQT